MGMIYPMQMRVAGFTLSFAFPSATSSTITKTSKEEIKCDSCTPNVNYPSPPPLWLSAHHLLLRLLFHRHHHHHRQRALHVLHHAPGAIHHAIYALHRALDALPHLAMHVRFQIRQYQVLLVQNLRTSLE
ncbi:hypothetical protein CRYUN_Cryun23aG0105600 [Craigia yunnanensis]